VENKVFDISDARGNHEVYRNLFIHIGWPQKNYEMPFSWEISSRTRQLWILLTLWGRFFKILAHPVYKM